MSIQKQSRPIVHRYKDDGSGLILDGHGYLSLNGDGLLFITAVGVGMNIWAGFGRLIMSGDLHG